MQITDKVWLLECSRAAGHVPGFHCYLIKDVEGLTLVDTSIPGRAEAILEEIEQLGFEKTDLKRIFLTHGDMDHIGNAFALKQATGCKVYASARELPLIEGSESRGEKKDKMFADSKLPIPEISAYPESIPEYILIATPGHTPGHVALLFEDCLMAGDACSTEQGEISNGLEAFSADPKLASQSFQKLFGYEWKWVCPGHGMPMER